MLNEGYFDWLYCHKTWVSAAPVLFMEVIAIFEQLYFQPVKQIAYCHVTMSGLSYSHETDCISMNHTFKELETRSPTR